MGAAHTKTHTNGTETTKAAQGVTLHGFVSCPSWDRTRTLLIQSRTRPSGAGPRSPCPEPHGAAADRAESALAHTKTHTIGTGTALALAALLLALAGCLSEADHYVRARCRQAGGYMDFEHSDKLADRCVRPIPGWLTDTARAGGGR